MKAFTDLTRFFRSDREPRLQPTGRRRRKLPPLRRTLVFEPLESRILPSVGLLGVPTWMAEGPAPITDGGTFNPSGANVIGPTAAQSLKAGAINAIAVDPMNTKHLYAATVNGGIWQTNDFTVANPTWTTTTDRLPSLAIESIAFSPVNSNVIYAGTGSYSSIFFVNNFTDNLHVDGKGGRAVGVYKSTDGGVSWQIDNPNGIFSGLRIIRIIPTSLNGGQTVFAATTDGGASGGVFRSDDGGGIWTRLSGANGLPNSGVTDLVENPNNANQFFAATSNVAAGASAGVYMLDLGVSTNWVNVTNNIAGADLNPSMRIELSVSPAGANPVWASIINRSGFYQRIYRGVAGGGTVNWAQVGPSGQSPDVMTGNQGSVHGAIVADPTADNLVYVAGDRINTGNGATSGYVVRGDSTANTWTGITPVGSASGDAGTALPSSNPAVVTSPHADARGLVFAAGGVLLYGSDGGVYQATSPSSGTQTWTYIGGTIQDTEFYNISYDSQFDIILGGAQDNGTPSQNAPGSLSSYHDESGGDGGATAVDNFSLAGMGESDRYFFGNVRKVFNGANSRPGGDHDANILPPAGLAGLTSAMPSDLFSTSVTNAVAGRIVVSGGTAAMTPVGAVYESSDAGTGSLFMMGPSFFVNDTWTQIPTGPGFVSTSVMAYGGRSGGVNNPDVLYAASGSQIFLRTAPGGTLNATAAQPGGGTIIGITLDPNDWRTAFVTDGSRVFMTKDAGTSWTNVTGNLNPGSSSRSSPTLAAIGGSGDTAVLFGFTNGVQRMLVSAPGVWTRYGAGLPNSVIGDTRDLVYNPADDVLVVGSYGRGAWEVASASTTVFNTAVLEIDGDTNFAGEDDTIKLIIDQNNPSLLDVFLNGALSQVEFAIIQQINAFGLGGNDALIVDSSNGLINVGKGIRYDGGTGFDQLSLLQTDGPTQTSDTYSVGPTVGEGISTIVGSGGGGTQTVFFQNLSPVTDLVPAATLTVNATPADNAINYTTGSLVTRGLVTIDNQESLEFANKTALVINSGAGTDTMGVNNPNTPTGLTSLTVDGGDPTAGDTLIVTGVGGAVTVNTGAGTITGATGAGGGVPITFATIENLALPAGIGALTLTTTGADDTLEVTPGASPAGSNSGTLTTNGAAVLTFANTGSVTANLGGGADTVVVNGSAGADTVAVSGTAVAITGRNAVNYTGAESLTVNGLAGNDTFNVTPAAGVAIFIDGGDPIGVPGDQLNLAAAGTVTFTSGPTADAGGFAVTGDQPVSFAHIEAASVTGAAAAVINGTTGPDTITVIARDSSTSAGADGVQDFTAAVNAGPAMLFLNTPLLTVNALDGSDEVVLQAPAPNNAVWNVQVTITGGPPAASDTLVVETPGATAETAVYTPTAADGGMLNLSSLTSLVTFSSIEQLVYDGQGDNDSLTVVGTSGNDTLVHTPDIGNQDGTIRVNSLLALSYQNLGAGASLTLDGGAGTDTLVVNGTDLNDSFTVAATGAIALNARLGILTANIETLTLEGLGGDDTFTLQAAISGSPYPTLNFDGGPQASAAGDRVNLIGTTGNDTFILNGSQVTQGAVTVNLSGIESGQLDALGGSDVLIYNGVSGVAEAITVGSSGAVGGGQLSVPGVLQLTFTNLETIDVNGNPGVGGDEDTLTFAGTNGADLFQINLAAAGTDADPILKLQNAAGTLTLLTLRNYTNFTTLHVNGLDGADTFNVFTGPTTPLNRNLFVDGGLPSAKQKLTDQLNIFYTPPRPKITASVATQDHDAGLVDLNYGTDEFLVQYTDIENVVIRKA